MNSVTRRTVKPPAPGLLRPQAPGPTRLGEKSVPLLAVFLEGRAHAVGEISTTDLSAAALPAIATRANKFCGFDGFPRLRFALARESGEAVDAGWVDDTGKDVRAEISPRGYSMTRWLLGLTLCAVHRKSSIPNLMGGSPTSSWLPNRSSSTGNGHFSERDKGAHAALRDRAACPAAFGLAVGHCSDVADEAGRHRDHDRAHSPRAGNDKTLPSAAKRKLCCRRALRQARPRCPRSVRGPASCSPRATCGCQLLSGYSRSWSIRETGIVGVLFTENHFINPQGPYLWHMIILGIVGSEPSIRRSLTTDV